VDWDTKVAKGRDLRLQPSCLVDSLLVHGGEPQTTPLVKTDGIDVVVASHEPEPSATRRARPVHDCFEERRPDPLLRDQRVEGNKLSFATFDEIGGQPHSLAAQFGHNRWKTCGIVGPAAAHYDRGTPTTGDGFEQPCAVGAQPRAGREACQSLCPGFSGNLAEGLLPTVVHQALALGAHTFGGHVWGQLAIVA
jgi:hypothetical protein